jgi:hypothetical protein
MFVINRRVASIAALLLLAVGLAACGDSEPDQRKAFIAFLQQINNRSGVHVLKPSADDEKAFGDYTKHYAVIVNFNKDMGVISQQYNQQMAKMGAQGSTAARTIEQMAAHREDVVAVSELIDKMMPEIDKRLAQGNAERAALKQPEDLKTVYDITYARVVTAPAQAIQTSNRVLSEGTKVSLQLADYINSHRGKLTVKGSQILANDNKTLAEVGVLLKAHQDAAKRFQDAQRDGQKLLQGN